MKPYGIADAVKKLVRTSGKTCVVCVTIPAGAISRMSDEVKYKVVAKSLEGEIRAGKYAGRLLPSEAQLVRRFGVGRKTVQRAILELQYNGLVARKHGKGTFLTQYAARATGLLGLLIPDASSAMIFQSFSREIARIGQDMGYTFLFGEAAPGDPETIARQTINFAREFAARHVEGVIFRPIVDEEHVKVNLSVAEIFWRKGIPLVLIDSDIVSPPERSKFDIVGIDNVMVGRRIADHLFNLGKRRVAFLMDASPLGLSANLRSRLFGLAGAVVATGGEWNDKHVFAVRADDIVGVRRMLRRTFRPDAIVCANDVVAIRLMQTLSAIGIRVPEDVAVVGCDDVDSARLTTPPLTTVHQPAGRIAEQAFRTLLARIRHADRAPRQILFDAPLVPRVSTLGNVNACPRKSKRKEAKTP